MRLNFFSQSSWKLMLVSDRLANQRSISQRLQSAAICGSILGSLLWGNFAQAQVSLSPLVIDVPAKAGKARGVIDIRNTSDREFRARIYAEPFTYDRQVGLKILTTTPTDLRPYLQFSPQEISIPPGGLRRVRVTIQLPANIADGEYRAMIFTEPLADLSKIKISTTNIVTRIGTAFYVHQGNLKPNLNVDSVVWDRDAQKLQLLVRNTGKASIQAAANWIVSQDSKVVQTGDSILATVIADGDRYLPMQSKSPAQSLAPGSYQVSGTLTAGREIKQTQNFNFTVIIPPTARKLKRSIPESVKP